MTDYTVVNEKFETFRTKSFILEEDWSELHELIQQIHVPENTTIDSRPFEKEDFLSIPNAAKSGFHTIQFIFNDILKLSVEENSQNLLDCIYAIVVLCGEHSCPNLWTDEECVKLSTAVLESVLKLLKCERFISFLMKRDSRKRPHGVNIFSTLLPKLTKESWKYNPSMVQCYSWLLHHIKMPDMKEYVSLVLPVSLIILNEYAVESKIIGLDCLRQIVTNISKAELHWHIEIKIIQDILKPLFYFRESDIILPLIKCTLEIADRSKPGFKDAGVDLRWSYFDDILNILLPMMEYEQDLKRRTAYANGLNMILKSSDFAIGRWSKRLLFIIEDYAKISKTEIEAVTALNQYIKICWPLAKNHWTLISAIAGRIILTCENTKTIEEAELTFQLLKELLPEETKLKDAKYYITRRQERGDEEVDISLENMTCEKYFKINIKEISSHSNSETVKKNKNCD